MTTTTREGTMPKRKLTPEQVSEAVGLYEAGESIANIAEHFVVSAPTIRARLKERGLRLSIGRALSQKQVREAASLYRSGKTIASIAKRFSRTERTIRRVLVSEGVSLRCTRSRAITGEQAREALRLYSSGLSLRNVAKVMGISHQTASDHIKAQGGKLRGNGGLTEWSDEVRRRARAMRDEGATLTEISDRLGPSPTTVAGWVRQ